MNLAPSPDDGGAAVRCYRTPINVKGGLPEKLKAGLRKYSPRLRTHTLHKIKRK